MWFDPSDIPPAFITDQNTADNVPNLRVCAVDAAGGVLHGYASYDPHTAVWILPTAVFRQDSAPWRVLSWTYR